MKQLMWKSVESGEVEIIGIFGNSKLFWLNEEGRENRKKKKKEN